MRKARKIWAVGLASLALGLIAPTGASAAQFTSEPPMTVLTGSQVTTSVMAFDTAQEVKCESFSLTTEILTGSAAENFEFTPSYSGCIAFGLSASITSNGCKYKIYPGGTIDLVCPAGKDIMIDTAGNICNVTIQPQTGLSGITITSGTWKPEAGVEKSDLLIDLNITNLKYVESGFGCVASGKATTGGKLEGSLTVTARDAASKGPQGISLDP